MAIIHTVGGTVSAANPWDVDLGTHSFTAGNRVVFFYGAHGTGPVINTIEFEIAGAASGAFLSKLDDIAFGSSYWEVWAGILPSTATTYDLTVTAASTLVSGGGWIVFELDDVATQAGPESTGSYTGATTALPVVTTNRAALIITGSHGTTNYSNVSTIDDSFTEAVAASRQLIGYRYESGGVTTAATVDWQGSSETGDAVMLAVYLEPDSIVGTLIVGEDGHTSGLSRVFLANLDGTSRTLSDTEYTGSAVIGGNLTLLEQSTVPNAIAGAARIWAEDNGAGKTRVMCQFGSGSAVQIAIEP
jgi:hypothetical protein